MKATICWPYAVCEEGFDFEIEQQKRSPEERSTKSWPDSQWQADMKKKIKKKTEVTDSGW